MAQILSSDVFRNRLLADGRRRIRYRYVVECNDLSTEEYITPPFHRPGSWDVNGNLSLYADSHLERKRNIEDNKACDPEFNGNSLVITQNSKYSTQKRIAKKLIRWMMREKDIRIVLWLEPLITWIKVDSGYTNAQIRSFLDIDVDQLQKMNRRIKAILEDPDTIKSTKTLVAEFDVEEAEWD